MLSLIRTRCDWEKNWNRTQPARRFRDFERMLPSTHRHLGDHLLGDLQWSKTSVCVLLNLIPPSTFGHHSAFVRPSFGPPPFWPLPLFCSRHSRWALSSDRFATVAIDRHWYYVNSCTVLRYAVDFVCPSKCVPIRNFRLEIRPESILLIDTKT